jgi:hypothetical protein
VDGSVVIVAFPGLTIAAEINPDEPFAFSSSDDLANFVSHRNFLLGSPREAHTPHSNHGEASIYEFVRTKPG